MIKSISVKNKFLKNDSALINNNTINLSLSQPWNTGLVIESITGLGPVNATINTTDLVTMDGALFNSARQGTRNIVINFKLYDVYDNNVRVRSVEDVRHLCYTIFPPKEEVELYFETDSYYGEGSRGATDHRLYTIGHVESNEPDIFNEVEGQQISIICSNPYFINMAQKEQRTEEPVPQFEFLFKDDAYNVESMLEGHDICYKENVTLAVGSDLTNCFMKYNFPVNYDISTTTKTLFKTKGRIDTTTVQSKSYTNAQLGRDNNGNALSNPSAGNIPDDLFIASLEKEANVELQLYSTSYRENGKTIKELSLRMLLNNEVISSTTPWLVSQGKSGLFTFPDYIGKITLLGDSNILEHLEVKRLATDASFIPYDTNGAIIFSELSGTNIVNIYYDGEVNTGCVFTLHMYGPVSNITLTNLNSQVSMTINTSKIQSIVKGNDSDLVSNDIIRLSTVYNNKYIRLFRNGKDYQILGCLPKDTKWLYLQDGDNMFLTTSESGNNNYIMDVSGEMVYNGV